MRLNKCIINSEKQAKACESARVRPHINSGYVCADRSEILEPIATHITILISGSLLSLLLLEAFSDR